MNWLNWKPSKKAEKKSYEKTFAQWEQDQNILVQKTARHYLYIEPRVSNLERETLKKIFRQTISTGSHLHRCTDAEQAERFNNFLMRNLPENFASGVIRDCEINTFNCKDDGRY
tara:strand:- start:79 stop:420 length:342 start_codon:yes stop_codon:yes gene_type:complete